MAYIRTLSAVPTLCLLAACGALRESHEADVDLEPSVECDEDWNARIAQGLLMQRVGLYWSKNSQRGARTVDSMCSAMENLKLQGYGGVGSEGAPYRFWNLYVRVVFYDAFMLGHAEDWPELTQLAIEEANPGWRSAVKAGASGAGGRVDNYVIWPEEMPRTDGDPGISSGLCQGTAYVILQHLIREHSVASASDDDHWFALDLDSDAVVDIKIGREEVTQLARLLHPR